MIVKQRFGSPRAIGGHIARNRHLAPCRVPGVALLPMVLSLSSAQPAVCQENNHGTLSSPGVGTGWAGVCAEHRTWHAASTCHWPVRQEPGANRGWRLTAVRVRGSPDMGPPLREPHRRDIAPTAFVASPCCNGVIRGLRATDPATGLARPGTHSFDPAPEGPGMTDPTSSPPGVDTPVTVAMNRPGLADLRRDLPLLLALLARAEAPLDAEALALLLAAVPADAPRYRDRVQHAVHAVQALLRNRPTRTVPPA